MQQMIAGILEPLSRIVQINKQLVVVFFGPVWKKGCCAFSMLFVVNAVIEQVS